ncbi:MAG: membrane protein insertase YidC [Deltaproteobacteria bacterium]|nr:membrane protein insertase YidC [Deltaproteobacteria bacterium]
MKSEHRSLLAIALSTGVLILWFTVIAPPPRPGTETVAAPAPAETSIPEVIAPSPVVAPPAPVFNAPQDDPQGKIALETSTLQNDLVTLKITSDGAVVTSWSLKNYTANGESAAAVEMVQDNGRFLETPLDASLGVPERPRYKLVRASNEEAVYVWQGSQIQLTKTIRLQPNQYVADVTLQVENRSHQAMEVKPGLTMQTPVKIPKAAGGFLSALKPKSNEGNKAVYYLAGKTERRPSQELAGKSQVFSGNLYWAGMEDRYFLAAILPRVQSEGTSVEYRSHDHSMNTTVGLAKTMIAPAASTQFHFSVFAGPKDIEHLKAVGLRLDEAIDYGWFSFVAVPILHLLKFFYRVVPNYGLAIILLTVFIKLLMQPLTKKSMKSMKAMQVLQPRMKELQAKYKNDRMRLNQEMANLFRAHKVNPASGCLPMLAQFPIYIALWKVLWNAIELYHAPFFGFYHDLSAPDPYFITPIILGLFMFAQQKMTPTASMDPAQAKAMLIMPVMFSAFMLFLPVGLVVYILVNTAMTVIQQGMYNKGLRMRDVLRGKFTPVTS